MKHLLSFFCVTLLVFASGAAICEGKAAKLALNHAGVEKIGPRALYVAPVEDDGRLFYEVKFHDGAYAYEYKIDCVSTAILKSEKKLLAKVDNKKHSGDIGGQKARTIALEDAKADGKASNVKVDRRYNDGHFSYEIEFQLDGMEHEYVIDTATGQILKHEIEND